jgi:hypothetical protein
LTEDTINDSTALALDSHFGYRRSADQQQRFEDAAESLLLGDEWSKPVTGDR